MHISTPTDEEVAAALAAVLCVLEEAAAVTPEVAVSGWQASIKLLQQHVPVSKSPLPATWGTIERLRWL